jgi:ketosteroid isomerase-like protein
MSAPLAADTTQDEAALRATIARWRTAFAAKNIDGLTADYAPDIVLFDVRPPYRHVGIPAIKKLWQHALLHFPASFTSEHHDLHIEISNGLAFVYGLHHITSPTDPHHPACGSYVRVTACFRKIAGQWKAIHEHVSFPVDPTTGRLVPITDPTVA